MREKQQQLTQQQHVSHQCLGDTLDEISVVAVLTLRFTYYLVATVVTATRDLREVVEYQYRFLCNSKFKR